MSSGARVREQAFRSAAAEEPTIGMTFNALAQLDFGLKHRHVHLEGPFLNSGRLGPLPPDSESAVRPREIEEAIAEHCGAQVNFDELFGPTGRPKSFREVAELVYLRRLGID